MGSCPRCDGALERYELGDRAETACMECGFVGVAVDHGSEPNDSESWGEALDRFYEKHGSGSHPEAGETADGTLAVGDGGRESDDGETEVTPGKNSTGETATDAGETDGKSSGRGGTDRRRNRGRGRERERNWRIKRGRKRAGSRRLR